jgi:hypothetical protein
MVGSHSSGTRSIHKLMIHRRAKEAEMEKKLVQREEAAMMKEKQYATLDQEVKDTKKKLKKLLHKHEVRSPQDSALRLYRLLVALPSPNSRHAGDEP